MMTYGDTNEHRAALVHAFGGLTPKGHFTPPDLTYVFILYSNRCGSNFLAQALASTGVLNEAGEVFNSATILQHARAWHLTSLQQYFCFLPSLVPHNEWLATKLAVKHLYLLKEGGILDAIAGRTRFLLMERRDRLAQAISRCIAWQNLRWTSEHPSRVPDACLVYSRAGIAQQLRQIEVENGLMYRFLAGFGSPPFHLAYEAFVAEPQSHLDEIAAWLGVRGMTLDASRIRIKRQSNAVNDAWRRRFLAGE